MLSQQFRITKKEDFEAVYRGGKSFSAGMMIVAVRNSGSNLTRFGIVASAKFSKLATQRNRIKRQIREIVRKNQKNMKSGYDIVISVRKIGSKTNYSSREIEKAIGEIFHRAKLINEKKN
jgi:ribonuclease P protein component